MKEWLKQSFHIAGIMVVADMCYFSIFGDENAALLYVNHFFYLFLGTMALLLGIQWAMDRKTVDKLAGFYRGYAFMTVISVLGAGLALFGSLMIPVELRTVMTINILIYAVLRILEYRELNRMAKVMNGYMGGSLGKTLVVDLDEKPASKEEFFRQIENYCVKNGKTLEYVEKEVPAIVMIDGRKHQVSLIHFYYIGVMYALEFKEI